MKKTLLLSIAVCGIATIASAQTYNPYTPQPQNYGAYYNYGTAQQARPQASKLQGKHKQFSIGFDYVLGEPSISSTKFSLKNPLPGGFDYEGNTDKFDDSVDAINVNFGYRPFRYFGFEVFYQKSLSDNQIKYQESYSMDPRFAMAEYNLEYTSYGLDVIGFLPVAPWLEVLGTVGVAKYDFTAEAEFSSYFESTKQKRLGNTMKFNEDNIAYRYGAGLQIWLSQRLAFRAMYRYASIGGDYFDDIQEISLGLRYNF